MIAIIKLVLPMLLKIIGLFVDKGIKGRTARQEARNRFYLFLDAIEPSLGDSARLRKNISKQRKELLDKWGS